MVQEMVITLREGAETSLMLALLFSALKTAGHAAYRAAAWVGFGVALALSIAAGYALRDLGSFGPLFEGALAWIGAGFVASLAVQLHTNGGAYRERLPAVRASAASSRVSWVALFTVASFAFVTVIREGLETAVFLSNSAALRGEGAWLGAAVGLSLAAGLGISIYLGVRRLHLGAFMRTTEVLLAALVASLFLTGAAEFREAGLLDLPRALGLFQDAWVRNGLFLQLLLCAAPFLYVALARAPFRDFVRAAGIAAVLAVTPALLGAAARQVEHAGMGPGERVSALRVEAALHARETEMTRALGAMEAAAGRGAVPAAREAWIQARSSYVGLEPYIALGDPEAAEALNGEAGESGGFHGVEETLFATGATGATTAARASWASDPAARRPLFSAIGELRARARAASAALRATVASPARVRVAWGAYRWTLMGRLDGQESVASQTSLTELTATLRAMDEDLGDRHATAGVRRALAPAVAAAARGPRYGEWAPESSVSLASLHRPVPVVGPDRGFDLVDQATLRRRAEALFDGIAPATRRL
jgi:high-affinity iron transporter